MKLAVITALPPAKTGVAHYSAMVLPALARRADVRAFTTLDGYRREDYDQVVYQLGNNLNHELAYHEAMREPGVIVIHDLVLHHLIVEMTLARGDVEGYVRALEASHGPMGAAWARGRAAGLHTEMGNFLLPASVEVASRSVAVIVHNHYAKERLESFGVTTPVHVVPHPFDPETPRFDRDEVRARHGLRPGQRVIGFFGFLTAPKRADVVLEAFRRARVKHPDLVLLIVGQPAPNIDVAALAGEGVIITGYVSDEDFPAYYAAADRLVNLRYPSAGESSGTLMRAFDAGKSVAVSDYAQFAELPETVVFKVPFGEGEVERLVEFFLRDFEDVAPAQRAWLEGNATVELTAEGYMRVVGGSAAIQSGGFATALLDGIPLFAEIEASISGKTITLRNRGKSVIRTRTYGQPEYRVIAKLFDGEEVIDDCWLALPRDLHPGETAEIDVPFRREGEVRLYHALQDVPMLEPERVR